MTAVVSDTKAVASSARVHKRECKEVRGWVAERVDSLLTRSGDEEQGEDWTIPNAPEDPGVWKPCEGSAPLIPINQKIRRPDILYAIAGGKDECYIYDSARAPTETELSNLKKELSNLEKGRDKYVSVQTTNSEIDETA